MKEKRILCCICAACLSTLLFCGCESWKRTPSPDAPKEVPVSAPADAVEEEEDFEIPNEESEEDIEQENVDENSFLAQSASIVSRTDESVRWETQDEMLSQKLYDLLRTKLFRKSLMSANMIILRPSPVHRERNRSCISGLISSEKTRSLLRTKTEHSGTSR